MVKSLSKDMLSFHFDSMFLLDSIFLFDCVRTITHYIIHIANHYELWWIFFSAGYSNKLTDTSQMDPDVQKSYAHHLSEEPCSSVHCCKVLSSNLSPLWYWLCPWPKLNSGFSECAAAPGGLWENLSLTMQESKSRKVQEKKA